MTGPSVGSVLRLFIGVCLCVHIYMCMYVYMWLGLWDWLSNLTGYPEWFFFEWVEWWYFPPPPRGDFHVLILRISFGQNVFAYVVVLGEMSLIYWVGPESNEMCIHKRKAERYLRQTEGGKIQRRGGGSVTLEAENEQWGPEHKGMLAPRNGRSKEQTVLQKDEAQAMSWFQTLGPRPRKG